MSFIVSSPPGTALLLFGFKRLLIFYQNDLWNLVLVLISTPRRPK
jgi:hypothetical protein